MREQRDIPGDSDTLLDPQRVLLRSNPHITQQVGKGVHQQGICLVYLDPHLLLLFPGELEVRLYQRARTRVAGTGNRVPRISFPCLLFDGHLKLVNEALRH